MAQKQNTLRVGLVGAGIGGLAAAIAIARAGADVTVLEAAQELGEIGAGIQMTPNAARLLRAWGVDKVIGDNLVRFEELNLRRKDGTKVGGGPTIRVEKTLGQPWWLVHRAHLHEGLVDVARKNGCDIHIDSRVASISYQTPGPVQVQTERGATFSFDLLIGSDGVGSIVRRTLFPSVKPSPPTTNCAYRAVVPYSQIRKDPSLVELVSKPTMEVWMAPHAYIITYPISAGKDFNMVLSHHRPNPVIAVEDVDMNDFRNDYRDFDPRIRKIIDMVPTAKRWPLLVTGPLDTWSSPQKNVVLMGDAAHSMVNHMAQGAATAMEDGAFLGRVLRETVSGRLSLAEAITIYEKSRMPKAYFKQQVSFLNGYIWHLPEGQAAINRDKAMEVELKGEQPMRTPNLYVDPTTVLEVYGYDAEADADEAIRSFLEQHESKDESTGITKKEADKILNWFLPEEERFLIPSKF
ncbi:FAD/NAD(P)-binding domain-containing protein [Glonium stellatum]|uniref:FAD/NAD(P)-binding domain-containing protein n=1 Tax=Glonium stellatum TaxID=574774 RepID=A0A8E2FCJ1_9PEZI|nr:FAD/NAD(P)-binding domain-containing protein [Glonium stellatum]